MYANFKARVRSVYQNRYKTRGAAERFISDKTLLRML